MVKLNHISSSHHIMSTTPQGGRSAIESIVRELEKIPEPMQLSVLEFIRSLQGSANTEDSAEQTLCERHPSTLPPRILGLNRGAMKMSDDFDEPLPDEFWLGEE
jgi:hypothetical protein